MTDKDKVYSFLGLCMKAGKLISGETGVLEKVTSGRARLVIISEDASGNTRKEFENKCKTYKVPLLYFGDKVSLGRAIGKSERSSLAITDAGMAKGLKDKLQILKQDGGETNGEN
ncbi:L7Ae/L30e/S12e/Gadd45 family ribosomal protein [Butyrivibrio sp. MC2013]|uniref:L7Ae/L30e/S12e/Gadd45 family ribosomal protein n=1 Tax=Butyrivibrio sp. MC2013 TaxID=1280686 RepID=UPI00040F5E9B|nr:ribosomal L7Ae/L30e/S12e/Gadd45 family protein [Butyrivibrio sp. MC2013]